MEPRILVLNTNFSSGDAISIENLFSKFNTENLFVASRNFTVKPRIFKECYLLGAEEIELRWPFSLFGKLPQSNIFDCSSFSINDKKGSYVDSSSLKHRVYENYLFPFLGLFSLLVNRYSFHLSDTFIDWIERNKPDYIYTSVGCVETAKFIYIIHRRFPEIKIIYHGFDDWISPSYKIINKKRIARYSNNLLDGIIRMSSIRFAVTAKMADEYAQRYGRTFYVCPNGIDVKTINPNENKRNNSIVYIGGIGDHNIDSMTFMARAIQKYNEHSGRTLLFDIYSKPNSKRKKIISALCQTCRFTDWVDHSSIMSILQSAHVLYLPISLSKDVVSYTRYSMSTKMCEYMASGTPVIYVGPQDIAMTELLEKYNAAFVINEYDFGKIDEILSEIDKGDAENKCKNALALYKEQFEQNTLSERFRNIVIEDFTKE